MTDQPMTDIPGYPGYLASPDGRVYRTINDKLVEAKPIRQPSGYNFISVRIDGRKKVVSRARLICLAHHGPKPTPTAVARHVDDDKGNDSASNLVWGLRGTVMSEVQRSRRKCRQPILDLIREGKSRQEILAATGCSIGFLYQVRREQAGE